jgi:hypothetical protein
MRTEAAVSSEIKFISAKPHGVISYEIVIEGNKFYG